MKADLVGTGLIPNPLCRRQVCFRTKAVSSRAAGDLYSREGVPRASCSTFVARYPRLCWLPYAFPRVTHLQDTVDSRERNGGLAPTAFYQFDHFRRSDPKELVARRLTVNLILPPLSRIRNFTMAGTYFIFPPRNAATFAPKASHSRSGPKAAIQFDSPGICSAKLPIQSGIVRHKTSSCSTVAISFGVTLAVPLGVEYELFDPLSKPRAVVLGGLLGSGRRSGQRLCIEFGRGGHPRLSPFLRCCPQGLTVEDHRLLRPARPWRLSSQSSVLSTLDGLLSIRLPQEKLGYHNSV